jgi:amino acid transporter
MRLMTLQEAVQAAGPFWTILGFLLLPFIWSVPEALICAELATAFPENAGYVVWVESAFGPFFGFLEGLFSWVSGVTDNTVNKCGSSEIEPTVCTRRIYQIAFTFMSTSLVITRMIMTGCTIRAGAP